MPKYELKLCLSSFRSWEKIEKNLIDCWFCGYIFGQKDKTEVIKELITSFRTGGYEEVQDLCAEIRGHYALIITQHDRFYMRVDNIRSVPLYYSIRGDSIYFGDSAAEILGDDIAKSTEISPRQALSVSMLGYTIGDNSLYDGLNALGPGSGFLIDDAGRKKNYLGDPYCPHKRVQKESRGSHELALVLEDVFKDLVSDLRGRQVVIPLSAGNDSRLILAILKDLGYKNIFCYTYGIKGSFEVRTAEKIAQVANVPWKFVEISLKREREFFKSQEFKRFRAFSETFDSLPYTQGLSSIKVLSKLDAVASDSVWINGNTGDFLTGGHIPKVFGGDDPIATWERVKDEFFRKHARLWASLYTMENLKTLGSMLEEKFQLLSAKDALHAALVFEFLEYATRQVKYVAGAQRAFEFYGYEWRLPFWDQRLMDFWSSVPINQKVGQSLYKATLAQCNFGGLWRAEIPVNRYHVSPLSIRIIRSISKIPFAFTGARGMKYWKSFDNCIFRYFYDNSRGHCVVPFRKALTRCRHGPKRSVSYLSESYLLEKGYYIFRGGG